MEDLIESLPSEACRFLRTLRAKVRILSKLSVNLTNLFKISEPLILPIYEFYALHKRKSMYFEALKLRNVRSGPASQMD